MIVFRHLSKVKRALDKDVGNVTMNSMPAFSKKEALSFGWKTFKSRWLFFVGLTILTIIFNIIPGVVGGYIPQDQAMVSYGITTLGWIFSTIVSIGIMKVMLRTVDGERPTLLDVLKSYRLFFKFFFASVLAGGIVLIGFILLIVPGILFSLRLQFTVYAIVDRGMGPIAAIKYSWTITRGHAMNILLFNVLIGLVSLLGVLALGVGLLVATPVTALSLAWVWRKLQVRPDLNGE